MKKVMLAFMPILMVLAFSSQVYAKKEQIAGGLGCFNQALLRGGGPLAKSPFWTSFFDVPKGHLMCVVMCR